MRDLAGWPDARALWIGIGRSLSPSTSLFIAGLTPVYGAGDDQGPYFFTLLAAIFTAGSSILVVIAVVTSNGFSMPR